MLTKNNWSYSQLSCKLERNIVKRLTLTRKRVSMGLTVNRQMALKLTVNRQKRNNFNVNRQMSEPKLVVKLLRYTSTIETD